MPTEDLSYFHEDEFKEKLALYEQMVKGGQSVYLEADELTDIAEYYLIQNKKQEATDCIQYALSLHPGSIDPLIFLARQKMFDGDTEGAKTISDCITDQHDREVVFFNAELLLREGKEGEACAYLEKMAETDDEDPAMYAYDTAVLFLERRHGDEGGVTEKYDLDATAARRIADLEREFQVSQSDLRATIQRLETVNGELQAANEELLTANEELQSSTEELQSVNEELYTVNTEHQLKLDELTMMTNDLSNFLSSTMIGILFVDSNLNIRKFTEYVGREFQLMEHDIGRPIQIFAHSFPNEDMEGDAQTVLKNLVSIDREVTAMNGRCYTLRIAPYRTTENSIRGLVITIIDSLGTALQRSGKDA